MGWDSEPLWIWEEEHVLHLDPVKLDASAKFPAVGLKPQASPPFSGLLDFPQMKLPALVGRAPPPGFSWLSNLSLLRLCVVMDPRRCCLCAPPGRVSSTFPKTER